MKTVRTVVALRTEVARARGRGQPVGLVPTMGAFHEGHLSLMRRARGECGFVVVSLFVNPTQFGPSEDLDSYPRDEAHDAALAREVGADLMFAPAAEEVYPEGFSTFVEAGTVSEVLCGASSGRGSGHFRAVATVVTKLLNMCQPDVAYFGQKDFQQTVVIRRLARDLDIPVRIEVCPTVRDADGLALSSRNSYLTPQQRKQALALKRALDAAEHAIREGARSADEAVSAASSVLVAAGIESEYVEIRSAEDLSEVERLGSDPVVVAVAAKVGRARLIDNTVVEPGLSREAGQPVAAEQPAAA